MKSEVGKETQSHTSLFTHLPQALLIHLPHSGLLSMVPLLIEPVTKTSHKKWPVDSYSS